MQQKMFFRDLEKPYVRSHWQNPFSSDAFSELKCLMNNTNVQWKHLPELKIEQEELNDRLILAQNQRRENVIISYI